VESNAAFYRLRDVRLELDRLELDRVERTLDAFPDVMRVAVEFCHRSWFTDVVRETLAKREVALCLADRHGPVTSVWRTAD
jgi:uncharacterized protein YecE (DUF72 family)